jgi:hypothetical protein
VKYGVKLTPDLQAANIVVLSDALDALADSRQRPY